MDPSQIALIAVAALFGGYLLVQVRPALGPRGRALMGEMRALRKKAAEAKSPEERGRALAEAGKVAAKARRWVAASGLFLRGLRADPTSIVVVESMLEALAPRPRLLASMLERRLSQLGDSAPERRVFVAMAKPLSRLYRGPLRRRLPATLLERLIAHEEAKLSGV